MRPAVFFLAFAMLACSVPANADLVATIPRVKAALVAVGTHQPTRQPQHVFQGTGFVVGDGLSVVTNAHVVPKTLDAARQESLIVLTQTEGRPSVRRARIERVDLAHDLVLLAIDGPPLPTLVLGEAEAVREGMEVAFTGFPLGMALGMVPVTHRGIVSAITPVATRMANARDLDPRVVGRLNKPFFVFQLDATAYPGNSGSPLYHPETGQVLGVVNSVFIKQSKEAAIKDPSGITYVIPVSFVRELLAASP